MIHYPVHRGAVVLASIKLHGEKIRVLRAPTVDADQYDETGRFIQNRTEQMEMCAVVQPMKQDRSTTNHGYGEYIEGGIIVHSAERLVTSDDTDCAGNNGQSDLIEWQCDQYKVKSVQRLNVQGCTFFRTEAMLHRDYGQELPASSSRLNLEPPVSCA